MDDLQKKYPPLQFPTYSIKLSKSDQHILVWDDIRKKNLVLSPEEWVRQHCVQYLMKELHYPSTQIQLEGSLKLNQLEKRFDILVNKESHAKILVECKAPSIKIDQKVFDQIARYNLSLNVPFLWVTNGIKHFFAQIDYEQKKYHFLRDLPTYEQQ